MIKNQKISELIFEYFKVEYEDLNAGNELGAAIKTFFTEAAKKNMSGLQIGQSLHGSDIERLRNKIVAVHPSNYNCYPIKLGGLKPQLQREAFEKDFTLHRYLLFILRDRKL